LKAYFNKFLEDAAAPIAGFAFEGGLFGVVRKNTVTTLK